MEKIELFYILKYNDQVSKKGGNKVQLKCPKILKVAQLETDLFSKLTRYAMLIAKFCIEMIRSCEQIADIIIGF